VTATALGPAGAQDDLWNDLERVANELGSTMLGSGSTDPVLAARLCELLAETTESRRLLREHVVDQRFRALERIQAGLTRLRRLGTTAELVREAAHEACLCCGFDRALASRVRGSTWVPQQLYVTDGDQPDEAPELDEYLAHVEIPLTPNLLETELARRGVPVLSVDPLNDAHTFKELMTVSQTRGYVAAPVMPAGRVLGFLHADCFRSRRMLTQVDRDNLWTFAQGLGLIFERLLLIDQLVEQRDRIREALRAAGAQIDELSEAEIDDLSREHGPFREPMRGPTRRDVPSRSQLESLLTSREREVLALMAAGARNRQIAERLVVSETTVKFHVSNISRKLGARHRAGAVAKYLQLRSMEQG
jgi:DNA-binding CsgD family transcriptional regulator